MKRRPPSPKPYLPLLIMFINPTNNPPLSALREGLERHDIKSDDYKGR
jgi:hypothetical protein